MTSLPAKVIAIEKRDNQYQVFVQMGTKYRGSFNTLTFGEIKPYIGSLKDGRLDLVYWIRPRPDRLSVSRIQELAWDSQAAPLPVL
jgi:hypothetical protein